MLLLPAAAGSNLLPSKEQKGLRRESVVPLRPLRPLRETYLLLRRPTKNGGLAGRPFLSNRKNLHRPAIASSTSGLSALASCFAAIRA